MYELTNYEVEFVSGDGKIGAVGTAIGTAGNILVGAGLGHVGNAIGLGLMGIGGGMMAFDMWRSS